VTVIKVHVGLFLEFVNEPRSCVLHWRRYMVQI